VGSFSAKFDGKLLCGLQFLGIKVGRGNQLELGAFNHVLGMNAAQRSFTVTFNYYNALVTVTVKLSPYIKNVKSTFYGATTQWYKKHFPCHIPYTVLHRARKDMLFVTKAN
jgi:hypothetical protein